MLDRVTEEEKKRVKLLELQSKIYALTRLIKLLKEYDDDPRQKLIFSPNAEWLEFFTRPKPKLKKRQQPYEKDRKRTMEVVSGLARIGAWKLSRTAVGVELTYLASTSAALEPGPMSVIIRMCCDEDTTENSEGFRNIIEEIHAFSETPEGMKCRDERTPKNERVEVMVQFIGQTLFKSIVEHHQDKILALIIRYREKFKSAWKKIDKKNISEEIQDHYNEIIRGMDAVMEESEEADPERRVKILMYIGFISLQLYWLPWKELIEVERAWKYVIGEGNKYYIDRLKAGHKNSGYRKEPLSLLLRLPGELGAYPEAGYIVCSKYLRLRRKLGNSVNVCVQVEEPDFMPFSRKHAKDVLRDMDFPTAEKLMDLGGTIKEDFRKPLEERFDLAVDDESMLYVHAELKLAMWYATNLPCPQYDILGLSSPCCGCCDLFLKSLSKSPAYPYSNKHAGPPLNFSIKGSNDRNSDTWLLPIPPQGALTNTAYNALLGRVLSAGEDLFEQLQNKARFIVRYYYTRDPSPSEDIFDITMPEFDMSIADSWS